MGKHVGEYDQAVSIPPECSLIDTGEKFGVDFIAPVSREDYCNITRVSLPLSRAWCKHVALHRRIASADFLFDRV